MRMVDSLLVGVIVPYLVMMPSGSTLGQSVQDPTFVASEDASPSDYGTCPSAQDVCYYYHGPDAVLTSYCTGYDCFKKTEFEQARVIFDDDVGLFPKTLKAWFADKAMMPYTAWTPYPCEVESSGNKFKLAIPDGSILCGAGLRTPETVYYWHVASNAETGCLAIGECKQPIIYTPPCLSPTQGPVGSSITIDDPQRRIQPGDEARFYPPGGDPLAGTACTDISIAPDGSRMACSVPYVPKDLQYAVSVVSPTSGEIRFDQLGFFVTP